MTGDHTDRVFVQLSARAIARDGLQNVHKRYSLIKSGLVLVSFTSNDPFSSFYISNCFGKDGLFHSGLA